MANPKKDPRSASEVVRRLLRLAEEQSISDVKLSKTMNVHLNTIWSWRSGRNSPDVLHVEALADAVGRRLIIIPKLKAEGLDEDE